MIIIEKKQKEGKKESSWEVGKKGGREKEMEGGREGEIEGEDISKETGHSKN